MQVGGGGTLAAAIADRHLHARKALLPLGVVIVVQFVPTSGGRLQISIDQRVLIARFARRYWPVAAAKGRCATLPTLLAAEIRQHLVIGPAAQAVRRPPRIVAAVAAYIRHRIDGRRSADHFAARAFKAASGHRILRLAVIAPVVNAVEQHLAPTERQLDERMAVPAAGFEQQHAYVRVGGETVGKCTAGGSRADDNVVETAGPVSRHATLNALGLAPVAAANAGRNWIAFIQRGSSAKGGRSIGKSRQRATIGPSAISASVNWPSANQDFAAMCPSKILSCETRSSLCVAKSAPRSAGDFLASLKTAT